MLNLQQLIGRIKSFTLLSIFLLQNIYMIVPNESILIKRKSFRVLFTLGLLCVLVAVVMRAIVNFNQDSCIYADYCVSTYGGPDLCLDQTYIYCCGGFGQEFCGSRNDCYEVSPKYNVIYCQGFVTTYWVLEGIAIFLLFALMFVSFRHRRRTQNFRLLAARLPENVVYTDAHVNRVRDQPERPDQQPQGIIINESVSENNPYARYRS